MERDDESATRLAGRSRPSTGSRPSSLRTTVDAQASSPFTALICRTAVLISTVRRGGCGTAAARRLPTTPLAREISSLPTSTGALAIVRPLVEPRETRETRKPEKLQDGRDVRYVVGETFRIRSGCRVFTLLEGCEGFRLPFPAPASSLSPLVSLLLRFAGIEIRWDARPMCSLARSFAVTRQTLIEAN